MPFTRRLSSPLFALALLCTVLSGCARGRVEMAPAPIQANGSTVEGLAYAVGAAVSCVGCGIDALRDEVIRAVAVRVADLKSRGGACQVYGDVLEGSLSAKRIVVRPFMWRVGGSLASAQARSSGEIDVARDVDALNIGRRSLDEVVHSVEHEAVHIAFAIPSGAEWNEARVNERVDGCRSRSSATSSTP